MLKQSFLHNFRIGLGLSGLLALLVTSVTSAGTASMEAVIAKVQLRAALFDLEEEPRKGDFAIDLVDRLQYENLFDLERAGLRSATLSFKPWSDSYWPMYMGILANRYADPQFPKSADWKTTYGYINTRLGKAGDSVHLSPAEKYDLLVGDKSFTLTRRQLAESQRYFERFGHIETWMGICHGWAPASFMVPRPNRKITVLAADGVTLVTFYPADLKGLTSLLWANGNAPTKYIGGRCDKKDPQRDVNNRPMDQECLDENPGTWHLVITNQIGVSKRGFVMDATYDAEVWNQPVIGYRYDYFNMKTGEPSSDLRKALVAVSDFPSDALKTHRSPKAKWIVGIKMITTYGVENYPAPSDFSTAQDDVTSDAEYTYDLELDANGKIVGGEWHSDMHPDFLWTPAPNANIGTIGDEYLDASGDRQAWQNPRSVMPQSWSRLAPRASQSGQPLRRVVYSLVGFSNQTTR